ncbi:unnamed protein product [Strongylus vulgaris]|uniref:Uncharacterized protein n=1 Tax=Strongylus vulgaris TaxID=40348 RepID=A0A3P7JL47_STRVU|nr:unnamed protein product [Strongylus vulgaris]
MAMAILTWNSNKNDDFKSRPIPEFAKRLTGRDLVDYVNYVQPFFTVNYSTVRRPPPMDLTYLDDPEGFTQFRTVRTEAREGNIPERVMLLSVLMPVNAGQDANL